MAQPKIATSSEVPHGETGALLDGLRKAGQTIVLTINGQITMRIHDEGSYQILLGLVDRLETIEALKTGIESFDRGEGQPARQAFEELRKKHGIPG